LVYASEARRNYAETKLGQPNVAVFAGGMSYAGGVDWLNHKILATPRKVDSP